LQGAFRDAVHELEAMAGQLKAERLYLLLLQIRRGEKDLGLRREAQYRDKVRGLVQQFKEKTTASELEDPVKVQLLQEIEIYRQTFEDYSREVLADKDIHGGKGPFRQAAHRIEALLNAHYVSDLESSILQLRRREKDYLLRGDKKYVDMALQELEHIDSQVDASVISAKEKMHFKTLLGNYRNDFLALIEQNDLIGRLTDDMQEAVAKIALLVKENVASANRTMAEMAASINASSVENARLMLWIVALASFLGVFFAITITLRIVRPLRRMAGLLDQLAYEESTQRMPFVPGGRDEVNAMAESVNTMADHKAHFIAWWKTSMQEADACRKLEESLQGLSEDATMSSDALQQTCAEFREAITEKRKHLTEQHQEIHKFNDRVVERTQQLLDQSILGQTENDIRDIQHSAKSIRNVLDMLSFQGDRKIQNP
jgi:methyl-accepting chemotaxis protein